MQQCDDLLHALGIEVRQRLVEQQQLRLADQGVGDQHALLFATGEAADPAVREPLGVDGMEHLVDPLALVLRASPDPESVPVDAEGDEVARAHRHVGVQQDLLRDIPERSAAATPRRAEDADLAGARALEPEDHAQEGRLPDAV